uniref:Uncharacterized protein n=1 Tax=Panagrolaimus davidi TaxID=227884 RepID=A0A914QJY3_9BILA
MISDDREFDISPNYFVGCGASAKLPSCSMFFGIPTGDFQMDMYFYSYYASDKPWAAQLIMNKLIRRNGILMQNQSQPFTPENPCTPELSPPNFYLYYGEPITKVALCCTRFQQATDSSIIAKQKLRQIVNDAKMKIMSDKKSEMPGRKLLPREQQPQKQLKQKRDMAKLRV